MKMKKVILVDFDGTTIYALDDNGIPIDDTGATRVLRRLNEAGHLLVLWTCRNEDILNPYNKENRRYGQPNSLSQAVNWFKKRNIPLFGVNNVPGMERVIGDSRKILGDILIDDTAAMTPIKYVDDIKYYDLDTREVGYTSGYSVDWDKIENWLEENKII